MAASVSDAIRFALAVIGAPDELTAVRERFGDWHDPIPELLAATPPDVVLRNDIHYLAEPLPSYCGAGWRCSVTPPTR
ncbi:hypothetical protein PSH03_000423 [Micromonospora sp. PSH03]|nr:hypothetical protein [Micromonospora salmantinae]MCG5455547.1 hypothetical protein [Micromonospora salmantinae]